MDAKERILHKSHDRFCLYGIRSVSMDDIATQLGMSKKTLYQCYTDKNELVDAVFTMVMEKNKFQCNDCRTRGKNSIHEIYLSFDMLQEMLRNMHPSVLFDLQKYHAATFKKFEEYRNGFLYRLIRQNLEAGIEQGLYREDIDVEILTRFRLHSVMLSFDTNVFPSNRTDLVYIEQVLLEHFLYGIATTKGRKLIEKYKNERLKQYEQA